MFKKGAKAEILVQKLLRRFPLHRHFIRLKASNSNGGGSKGDLEVWESGKVLLCPFVDSCESMN